MSRWGKAGLEVLWGVLALECAMLGGSGCKPESLTPPSSCTNGDVDCAHLNVLHPRTGACWQCVAGDTDDAPLCRLVEAPDGAACLTDDSCTTNDHCDDGMFCNGSEACNDGGTCTSSGSPCQEPTPACHEESDSCVPCIVDADCGNGTFCDGQETCVDQECVSVSENPCDAFGPDTVCSETDDLCLLRSVVFLSQNPSMMPLAQLGREAYESAARECMWSGRGALGPHLNFLPWFSVEGRTPTDILLAMLGPDRIFVLPDGTRVADNWADLVDGTLLAPINVTADGEEPTYTETWTGTNSSGEHTENDCTAWSESSSPSATIGTGSSTDAQWTEGAGSCNGMRGFYCFQVFPHEFAVKRVFLTSLRYRPGMEFSSVEDARQICETLGREAVDDASTNWDVWLSYDDSTGTPDPMADPFGRFTRHDGPYVTIDNHLVALDWDDLVDGDLVGGINVDENEQLHLVGEGGEDHIPVWTATNATGDSAPYDCDAWASSDAADEGMEGGATSAGKWWTGSGGNRSCDQPAHFYCVEQ